jgi:hypothetical protein
MFIVANLSAPPKTLPTPTIIPLVHKAQPEVPPWLAPITTPFYFQSTPLILELFPNQQHWVPFVYPRSFSYDEWLNCSTPLGIKSPAITVEHEQPHGWITTRYYGSNGNLYAIWQGRRPRGVGIGC